jgi:hypothetical protein
MPKSQFFLGLALGQMCDFSALAILELPPPDGSNARPALALPHLQRFPPGTPYLQIAHAVHEVLRNPKFDGSLLAADQTGVGDAVLALVFRQLRYVNAFLTPVTLSSGHAVLWDNGYILPKKELVGTLQVLLQTRRLHVARELPDTQMFLRELETFRVRVTTVGSEAIEAWREGVNDDLVFAVGLAAWMAEHYLFLKAQERALALEGAFG